MPLLFVRIYTDKGRGISIEVDNDESIGSIKERIGMMHKIPPRQLELYHGVRKLENSKTLRMYNFKEHSFSGYVYVNYDIQFKVIQENSQKPILMQVEPHKTIFHVKQELLKQLREEVDPSNIELIYYGKKLPDDKSLDACHVKQNSTLYMAISSTQRLFHGIAYKSMNYAPPLTYLRKNFGDVTRSITLSKLPQVREEQFNPHAYSNKKIPLLQPNHIYTQPVTNRTLWTLINQ